MKIRHYITFFIFVFSGYCSNQFETGAVFRGDSPFRFSITSLEIQENNSTTVTVSLLSKPKDNVVFDLVSSDTTEVVTDPGSFIFTPSNYNIPQTFTVLTTNDCLSDGTQNVSLDVANVVSADSRYNKETVKIPVTVTDSPDNLPNIVFVKTHDLQTSELGTKDFFKVNLSCSPGVGNVVTVPLEVGDSKEVALDKTTLQFDDTNYSQYQLVTITGLSDCALDADKTVSIRTRNVTSTIGTDFNRYHDTNPTALARKYSAVTVVNQNYGLQNEIVVTVPSGGLDMVLNYSGGHLDEFATVSVHLSCPIVDPVSVGFSFTSNFAEVVNTSSGNNYLTFDSLNWSADQYALIKLSALYSAGTPQVDPLITYYINVYESQQDNVTVPTPAVPSSVYATKSLGFNISVTP